MVDAFLWKRFCSTWKRCHETEQVTINEALCRANYEAPDGFIDEGADVGDSTPWPGPTKKFGVIGRGYNDDRKAKARLAS